MRVKTVQINWHDKLSIFSVDFDHNYADAPETSGWRFATGGGDNNVRVWRLRTQSERDSDPNSPPVEFLASLNRHTAPVNVVRFSPCSSKLASAGDDGVIIVWRHIAGAAPTASNDNGSSTNASADSDENFVEPETWRPAAMLRGSLADICDLAWSPDGRFIVSASVDNTARIWSVLESKCVQVLTDHTHYVQGVAWDPLGEFIVTQGSDRSMRVYRWIGPCDGSEIKPGSDVVALVASHYTMSFAKEPGQPSNEEAVEVAAAAAAAAAPTAMDAEQKPDEKSADATVPNQNVENMDIDMPPVDDDEKTVEPKQQQQQQQQQQNTAQRTTQRLFHDDNLASFFRRPSISPDGRLFAAAAGIQRDREARNTCYIWARDRLQGSPALNLAGHQKPVVATRWAPSRFAPLEQQAESMAIDGKGGWLRLEDGQSPSHRMMLAVASQSSVAIYDTSQEQGALGLMSGLHYAAITDLAWTKDGSHLVITSIDGFASVASIAQPSPPLLEQGARLPVAQRTDHGSSGSSDQLCAAKEAVVAASAVAASSSDAKFVDAKPVDAKAKGKKRLAPTLVSSL